MYNSKKIRKRRKGRDGEGSYVVKAVLKWCVFNEGRVLACWMWLGRWGGGTEKVTPGPKLGPGGSECGCVRTPEATGSSSVVVVEEVGEVGQSQVIYDQRRWTESVSRLPSDRWPSAVSPTDGSSGPPTLTAGTACVAGR